MNKKGFSLIEIMVVIAIVSILAAIALPMYRGQVARSRSSEGGAAIALIKTRQEAYRSTHFKYAPTLAALPGYNADPVDVGEFYRITISAADANTFLATASDLKKAIGSKPKGSDVWTINQDDNSPQHVTYGY